jgi:hypothetical protein
MESRHHLSTGILFVVSSISLSGALAQDTPVVERSNPFDCRPADTVEETLEEIERCTGQDLGPITGFEPGTTLEEAERLYLDMKIYAELIQRQWERQEEIIESLKAEIESLKEQPQLAEN